MKIAIDTNVLVRYLTWDDEPQARKAAELIEAADQVHVSTVVLCEVVWVLTRAYQYKRHEIVPVLERLVAGREFEIDQVAARTGLRLLEAGGDFADELIGSYRVCGAENLPFALQSPTECARCDPGTGVRRVRCSQKTRQDR